MNRESTPHERVCRPDEVLDLEARNGLLQIDEVRRIANDSFKSGVFSLDVTSVLSLHEFAVRDIYSDAGQLRTGAVGILGTNHVPPPASVVPMYVDEMVGYVNDNWERAKALHLCSYVMWRLNWIHPFCDGNGRTTRAVSYLVFLARLGYEPGGTPTFVDMIAADKWPYYSALDDADIAYADGGKIDVSTMENLVEQLLGRQLLGLVRDVRG